MRLCVLQTGSLPDSVPARGSGYGQMFVDLLFEKGQQWDIYDVESGAIPEDILAYDGFLITGSRHSVYDDLAWIRTLMDIIQEIHRHKIPLLGICFGHQAVVQALGGQVDPNPQGWDIGIRKVFLTPEARGFKALADLPDPFRILKSHRDIVVRLPPQALHLASSDITQYEMALIGSSALSMQGHPEFDNEVVRGIVENRHERGLIPGPTVQEALRTLSDSADRVPLQGLIRGFFRAGRLE